MDHYAQISVVILSFTLFVLVLLFIPFFYQIWKAAKNITAILQTLNQNLPTILENLEGMTATMRETATMVHKQLEELTSAARIIQKVLGVTGELPQILFSRVSHPLFKAIRTMAAIFRGIRIFASVYRSTPKD